MACDLILADHVLTHIGYRHSTFWVKDDEEPGRFFDHKDAMDYVLANYRQGHMCDAGQRYKEFLLLDHKRIIGDDLQRGVRVPCRWSVTVLEYGLRTLKGWILTSYPIRDGELID